MQSVSGWMIFWGKPRVLNRSLLMDYASSILIKHICIPGKKNNKNNVIFIRWDPKTGARVDNKGIKK